MPVSHKRLGKVHYLCNGRFVFGPDVKLALGAFLLILIPTIIYNVWSVPWIIHRWPLPYMVVAISVIMQITVLGLFIRTAVSDPGIVPREVKFERSSFH